MYWPAVALIPFIFALHDVHKKVQVSGRDDEQKKRDIYVEIFFITANN